MQITLDTDDARARLQEVAGQAADKAQEAAAEGRKRMQKRYGRRVKKIERKFERKLEHAARRLPVDTPVDKQRRKRTAKKGAGGTFFLFAVLAGFAVAYFAWKRQQESTPSPAPDAFGSGVRDDSGNGRRETATTHAPLS